MSQNIFEIWDKIGRETPFAVRRDNWSNEYYTIVEKVECAKLPYGKAMGFPTINGKYSDHYEYDKKWREEKLIPCGGCYQWTLVENVEINKPYVANEKQKENITNSIFTKDTKFNFGKYNGLKVHEVYRQNPQYIVWAMANIDKFCLTEQTIIDLRNINPEFTINEGVLQLNEKKLLHLQ